MIPGVFKIADLEALARERMERSAFDYYAGGAGDEWTLEQNCRGFDRIVLHPRVLVDVSRLDTSTELLGHRLQAPVLLAPTAFNRLAHPDGELAAARAAGACGTIMVVSTMSTYTLEEIAAAATGPLWFQLYIYRERAITADIVSRVERSGYRAIVLTVDTPVLGRRERDARNRFVLPDGLAVQNLEYYAAEGPADVVAKVQTLRSSWSANSSFFEYTHRLFDPSLTWETVGWLTAQSRLPVLLKGILTADDARRAADQGVAGIIVSNHGGRQLDGAVPAVAALAAVTDAVAGRIPVLMDGGVRRGVDVLKALALGARAVLIGRPYLWGLAVAGEDGVKHVLEVLRSELEVAMALSGRPVLADIDRTLVSIA